MKKIGIIRVLNSLKATAPRLLLATLGMASALTAQAAKMESYTLDPLSLDPGVAPLVMLAMSNDHQLYFKAYTDYDDLNGNGKLDKEETGYNHAHKYVGYFESGYCYKYASFQFAIDKEANAEGYCNETGGKLWSGNFLNWATMTRIDVLRKILYGGKRLPQAEDSTALAVLERSYLPNDAHSFAKYYNGADLPLLTPYGRNASAEHAKDRGLTLCNTTLHNNGGNLLSATNTNPPLMRAIQGNHSLWAASERMQCVVIGTPEDPAASGEVPTGSPRYWTENGKTTNEGTGMIVKPEKQVAVKALLGSKGFYPHLTQRTKDSVAANANPVTDFVVRVQACPTTFGGQITSCKSYPSETNPFRPVGLLQKYGDNEQIQWGLVSGSYEKNKSGGFLRKQAGFITGEINANTGNFKNVDGLIKNLDSVRIASWYWGGDFNGVGQAYMKTGAASHCVWGASSFKDGQCSDWGNPLGEIMNEAYRYLAGNNAPKYNTLNSAVVTQEANAPAGVTIAPWNKPLTPQNSCANLNVIGINTSAQSYDNDEITTASNIADLGEQKTLSSYFKDLLLPSGGNWLVGSNGTLIDNQCTPKTANSLEGLTGICPEAPRLQGSWDIAAVAKHVHDNDINTILDGKQYINTYGVSLSTALPSISVNVPGTTQHVKIVPACRAVDSGNCALVNFKVLQQSAPGVSPATGSFYVNWEDSEQGGDYDQDLQGIIDYEVTNAATNNVKITSQVIGQSTPAKMAFGFVITGVTDSGFKVLSGINGYPAVGCPNPNNCLETDKASTGTYTSTTSGADFLDPPLRFAAQYGNDNPDPETTYFNNNDPAKLEADLSRVLTDLGAKSATGGSQVASTTKNAGANLFLHSFYYAQIEESINGVPHRVNWIGQVGALFIDEQNNLREDTVSNGKLDNGDLMITFDATEKDALGQPLVLKKALPTEAVPNPTGVKATFKDIKYLWTTTDALTDVNIASRKIKTSIPTAFNTVDVISNGLQDFNEALFTGTNKENAALLGGYNDPAQLVDFVRGNEIDGLRSRTLADKKYLLGDITNTSPIIASTSDYSFDTELGDSTYTAYKTAQASKPIVVYTATNNGMIQAFNAGTYNKDTGYTGTTDPLGKELWAYIPFNLLPHLQWLADPFYKHVPYFNGFMRTYDVKIFEGATADSDGHKNGWGTILVVGTGLGGSNFPVKRDDKDFETRPAYIVLDISDRAVAPKLIAEIAHDQLGFTTGEPDVVRYQTTGKEGWFLVFGSGPRADTANARREAQQQYVTSITSVDADANAKKARVFAFNLKTKTLQDPVVVGDSEANAFVGGINSMDWNRDFADDAIYFGTVAGTQAAPTGSLMRGRLTLTENGLDFDFSTMFAMGKPVTARPTTVIDYQGENWVFAGSGRFYTRTDANTKPPENNQFVGIMETKLAAEDTSHASGVGETKFALNQLYNSTAITTYSDGTIKGALPADKIKTVDALRDYIHNTKATAQSDTTYKGWYRNFVNNTATGVDERQHSEAAYAAGTLLFGTSDPADSGSCDSSDKGYVYLIDMLSGIPSPYSSNATDASDTDKQNLGLGADVKEILQSKEVNSAIFQKLDPYTGKISLGNATLEDAPALDLTIESKRHSWREVPITW
ncbi:MAG: hypothetical protein U5M23_07910 [Marinagarivorans sp.]|nr:hypothetical protein [Marinagarivorans sp.]